MAQPSLLRRLINARTILLGILCLLLVTAIYNADRREIDAVFYVHRSPTATGEREDQAESEP